MQQEPSSAPNYHVLLIGIDDYTYQNGMYRLRGCVRDIDFIEGILIDKVGVPKDRIRRLASPRADIPSSSSLPSAPATRDNIRGALSGLAQQAQPGDRVFVYYTGHGFRKQFTGTGGTFYHEALAPVDFDADGNGRMLYDVELNGLLAAIAARTDDFTVVLDCCQSAGATRSLDPNAADLTARNLEIKESVPPPDTAFLAQAGDSRGLMPGHEDGGTGTGPRYLVMAACQANETAAERELPPQSGQRHGVMTYCLGQIVANKQQDEVLRLRWADVLPGLLGMMGPYSPQTPWVIGRAERRVFGGPWVPEDSGYPVTGPLDGKDAGKYRIGAGQLMGLTADAEVGAYGPAPALFPLLGSPEDLSARSGVLKVIQAGPSECTAQPLDPAFKLPQGRARGRLIRPGKDTQLRVQLNPHDEDLAGFLEQSGALQVLRPGSAGGPAEVLLRRVQDSWMLDDEVHQPDLDGDMAKVPADQRDVLLAALLHYADYNRTLRLVRMAKASMSQPGLTVTLEDCNGQQGLTPGLPGSETALPPLGRDPSGNYVEVRVGDRFRVRLDNRTGTSLYATLLNCTASGRVEYLDTNEVGPKGSQIFWLEGNIGEPFVASLPEERKVGIERMVVVATSKPGVDLSYLKVEASLAEVIEVAQGTKGVGTRELGGSKGPAAPAEVWTGETVFLRIRS